MRPFPLLVRVGLFAVGFGAGLSHYRAPATPRPVIIQLHIVNPEVKPTIGPIAPNAGDSEFRSCCRNSCNPSAGFISEELVSRGPRISLERVLESRRDSK